MRIHNVGIVRVEKRLPTQSQAQVTRRELEERAVGANMHLLEIADLADRTTGVRQGFQHCRRSTVGPNWVPHVQRVGSGQRKLQWRERSARHHRSLAAASVGCTVERQRCAALAQRARHDLRSSVLTL